MHPAPQPTRRQLALVAAAGLGSAAIRGYHDNLRLGSLLVDPYWVGFYVTNYQDGFRRRALIGTAARLLQPHGLPVALINGVALLALLAVLWLFVRAFLRLAGPEASPVFTFALFGSAIGSVYVECLGDTLQLAMLVFVAILALGRLIPRLPRPLLAYLALLLAFLVHEASVFLLTPVIPFVARPTGASAVRLRHFCAPVAALAVLLLLSIHWSSLQTHLTYHAISIPRGLPLEDLAATPSFAVLFRDELHRDFGSAGNFGFFLIKCLSIAGLAFAAVVALLHTLSLALWRRTVIAGAAILLFSIPLWIIAHDWGRFLGYTVFLALFAAAGTAASDSTAGAVPRLRGNPALAAAALLLLLASPYYQSRIFGMHIRDFLASLPILAVGLWFAALARRQRTPAV